MADELVDDTETGTSDLGESSSDSQIQQTEKTPDPAAPVQAAADGVDGPIPLDRHKTILENTRRELEERYGWAKNLDPRRVDQALRIADDLERDARGFHSRLTESLTRRGPIEAPGPDLEILDDKGRPYQVYSHEQFQRAIQFHLNSLREEFAGRLSPTESFVESTSALARADEQLHEARTWPQFKEHESAIAAELVKHQQRGRPISLERAYQAVVYPALEKTIREKTLTELKQKPGRSVRPGDPSHTAASDSEKSWGDIFAEEAARRAS